jgi:hypothetical protein
MVEFDEIALREEFTNIIREGFADYYDLLKTEVQVESEEPQESSFPCCIVSITNPISEQKYDDSDGSFRKIRFSLECDLYSNALKNFKLNDSVIKLSQLLIKIVISKYPTFVVTRNSSVPYRTDVKRRVVDFMCTYDVENKIIYSN